MVSKYVATRGMTIAEKLDHYTYPEPNTGCWLWGGCDTSVYGWVWIGGKGICAHRASWERHNGPIPNGLLVLHKCDVPLCINPEHLFLGTAKDNMQDAVRKGRAQRGERSGRAKLTELQVLDILGDSRNPHIISKDYGVGKGTIDNIKSGATWKHLTLPNRR